VDGTGRPGRKRRNVQETDSLPGVSKGTSTASRGEQKRNSKPLQSKAKMCRTVFCTEIGCGEGSKGKQETLMVGASVTVNYMKDLTIKDTQDQRDFRKSVGGAKLGKLSKRAVAKRPDNNKQEVPAIGLAGGV